MTGTTIIEADVVGSRKGRRAALSATTTTRRYDIYDGNHDYLRSESRTTGFLHSDTVGTEFSIVEAEGRRMEFDVGSCAPRTGEPVHVLIHRIGFATIVDLHQERFGMIVCKGDDDVGDAGRALPAIIALIVAGCLHLRHHDTPATIGWGMGCGLGLHMLSMIRRTYVRRGVALLRWRAVRRLKKKAASGTTISRRKAT